MSRMEKKLLAGIAGEVDLIYNMREEMPQIKEEKRNRKQEKYCIQEVCILVKSVNDFSMLEDRRNSFTDPVTCQGKSGKWRDPCGRHLGQGSTFRRCGSCVQ